MNRWSKASTSRLQPFYTFTCIHHIYMYTHLMNGTKLQQAPTTLHTHTHNLVYGWNKAPTTIFNPTIYVSQWNLLSSRAFCFSSSEWLWKDIMFPNTYTWKKLHNNGKKNHSQEPKNIHNQSTCYRLTECEQWRLFSQPVFLIGRQQFAITKCGAPSLGK